MPVKFTKSIDLWKCATCGTEWDLEFDARNCEEKCAKTSLERRWLLVFPISNTSDTRTHKNCVRCNIVVKEWCNDTSGDLGLYNKRINKDLFGGIYCEECYNKTRLEILQGMEEQHFYKEVKG